MEDETSQTLEKPGHSLGLKLGAEFIPWEVVSKKQHFSIDLGVGLDYVFEGREYSPLWEALGGSPCLTSNGCNSTTYARDVKAIEDQIAKYYKQYKNSQLTKDDYLAKQAELQGQLDSKYQNDLLARTDGITDVEHYGIYSGWIGMHVQPIEYFAIGAQFLLTYAQPHFITFADPGKDSTTDTDDIVTGTNSWGENEYNPKYLEAFDRPGNRFKLDQPFSWSIIITMTGQF